MSVTPVVVVQAVMGASKKQPSEQTDCQFERGRRKIEKIENGDIWGPEDCCNAGLLSSTSSSKLSTFFKGPTILTLASCLNLSLLLILGFVEFVEYKLNSVFFAWKLRWVIPELWSCVQGVQARVFSNHVDFTGFLNGRSSISEITPKWPGIVMDNRSMRQTKRFSGISGDYKLSPNSINQEVESFLLSAINMSFFERLNLAWKIVFPSPTTRSSSNARIAKQRLKMILFSDRCAVSDEAKQKIVNNIVHALSDFVEIESQDKVQLNVSTDTDLGTIYSVTVPVRRVKPEYQEAYEMGTIANVEYKDTGEISGSVDVRFDFFVPDE
ncbi:hypothetical protein JRO89_XS05G0035300 [Xanthoceras sorbifolium]|uniref:Plastid division regulator MinE n=1 Tax=Xanthoceras sorbifolium TaxID=99658 RepID=A0ABQ8I083_9ROSI|nr:hypothetical protein JRO89_XS05G0035300 [Xanthoceras sorbifolium]